MNALEKWMTESAAALDVGWVSEDRDQVLDIAREVAHGVARPAAPLTTYLVGVAVGRGLSLPDAVQLVRRLLPAGDTPHEAEPAAGKVAE